VREGVGNVPIRPEAITIRSRGVPVLSCLPAMS
jgi:hypothetical protein